MDFQFYMPVRLWAEENAVERHPEEFARYGKRCLIVTGAASAKLSGALDDVTAMLDGAGVAWQVFDQIGQNPLVSVCHRAGQEAAAFGADFLVGIGGGSPLDATKAAAFFAAHPDLPPMGIYQSKGDHALPFLLVGTTAGTGSEVTRYAVLTVDETGQKRSWSGAESYAKVAFGDARYTATLPRSFTVSTGLDALSHALEAYYSKTADSTSDFYALEATKLLLPALRDAWMEDGALRDMNLRGTLYTASLYAGMSLNRCGTLFCHQMGYALTEQAGVPHGYACAAFLPELLRHSVPLMPEKSQALFRAIGMYAADLIDTIAMLTAGEADAPPIDDILLETLLERWQGAGNMTRTPGNFDTVLQRQVAQRVLQKKL